MNTTCGRAWSIARKGHFAVWYEVSEQSKAEASLPTNTPASDPALHRYYRGNEG